MGYTEIEIPIDDLTKETYRFYFIGDMGVNPRLVLDFYGKYTRQTKRHGWKTEGGYYSRLHQRDSKLKAEDVPLSDDIKKMALDKFTATISVTR